MKNNISDDNVKKIISLIRHHINNKIPFALARYGDGEFDLLFNDTLTEHILLRYDRWFKYTPNKEYLLKFREDFKEASSHIDVVVFQTNERKEWESPEKFYNEMCNIIDKESTKISIAITNKIFGNIGAPSNSLLHEIIKPEDDLVLITCRLESKTAIQELTGANVRKIISIPSEGEFRDKFQDKDKKSQLPKRLNEIINIEIPKYVHPGTIVLLGTGPTKPMYCKAIKQYGGIAIDLGSTLDTISGYCTRGKNKGTRIVKNNKN